MSVIKGNVTVSVNGVNIGQPAPLIPKSQKIKTRLLVHIALNAKGERVGLLVCSAGRFIPLKGGRSLDDIKSKSSRNWLYTNGEYLSVALWKKFRKQNSRAVRFQRVMLVGGGE